MQANDELVSDHDKQNTMQYMERISGEFGYINLRFINLPM